MLLREPLIHLFLVASLTIDHALVLLLRDGPLSPPTAAMLCGLLGGQIAALAAWVALGRSAMALRVAVLSAALVAGERLVTQPLRLYFGEPMALALYVDAAATLFALAAMRYVRGRTVLNWAHFRGLRPGQYSLRHLLLLTTIVAVALALWRLATHQPQTAAALYLGVQFALGATSAAVLVLRGPPAKRNMPATTALVAALATILLASPLFASPLFQSPASLSCLPALWCLAYVAAACLLARMFAVRWPAVDAPPPPPWRRQVTGLQ